MHSCRMYGQLKAVQTHLDPCQVLALLHGQAEARQERRPNHLQHGPHALTALHRDELAVHAVLVAQLLLHRADGVLAHLRSHLRAPPGQQVAQQVYAKLRGGQRPRRTLHACSLALRPTLHADLVAHYTVIQLLHECSLQVPAVVDASIIAQELILAHLHLDLRVVRVCVEHDHRVRQHVRRVRTLELPRVGLAEPLCELLHQAVDLLSLPRQAEPGEEVPDGLIKRHASKVHRVHVGVHHADVELLRVAQELANHGAVQ
mmetsp:Transcript_38382/g.73546  ORF Transcript_38382/g.73546 Transcript_38382/m.73546 type:complete len:260 (-) Transcript_38382:194-973(-)